MRPRPTGAAGRLRSAAPVSSALAALLAALTILAAGCGDGGDGGSARASERIPISTVDYGTRPVDVGNPRELNRLANLYATLQRRFQAGDMAGVCARVSARFLDQFPPGPSDAAEQGSCATRMAAYARKLQRDGGKAPELTIDWLRIYDSLNIGGITATDDRGKALRVPFTRENGQWKLELGVFARPDTLAGTLTR